MSKEYKQLKTALKEKGCPVTKKGDYITGCPPLNVTFYTLNIIKELKVKTTLKLEIVSYSHFNMTVYYVKYKII